MTQWTMAGPPVSSFQGNVVGNARDADTPTGDDLSSTLPASDYEEVNSPQTQTPPASAAMTRWPDPLLPHSGPIPVFWTNPALQHSHSEFCIAAMYELLEQFDSSIRNIHSISDTFITDVNGIAVLLDVIVVPGAMPGICFSDLPYGCDASSTVLNLDTFRQQGLLPMLANNLIVREAAYAHSRLAPSSPLNVSSLRVLRYSDEVTSAGTRFLQSGDSNFNLAKHHEYECTFDDLQLHGRMDKHIVLENLTGIRIAMENTCMDWLIALLGALAIAPNDQKVDIVSLHQQYLFVLAELEQEAALQAGYTHCPMTSMPYANMTAEFRSVTDLLMQSICEDNLGGNQNPSQAQYYFAKSLGRLMAEWSPAPFFMDYDAQRRYQWYYFDVVAELRQDFEARVTPALVPNYLARGIGPAVSGRRIELEECGETGNAPGTFVLPLNRTPQVSAGHPLALKPRIFCGSLKKPVNKVIRGY